MLSRLASSTSRWREPCPLNRDGLPISEDLWIDNQLRPLNTYARHLLTAAAAGQQVRDLATIPREPDAV